MNQAEQTQAESNISIQIQEPEELNQKMKESHIEDDETKKKEFEAISSKQMDMAVKFIENNKSGLLQVYTEQSAIKEKEGEYGVMVVCFKEDTEIKNQVEVSYVPVHILPQTIAVQIMQLKHEEKNDDIIYFMINSSHVNQIIQININTLK